jgi:hypothetical protein
MLGETITKKTQEKLGETMMKKTQEEALLITIMKDEDIPKSLLLPSHEFAQSRTLDLTSQAWKQ